MMKITETMFHKKTAFLCKIFLFCNDNSLPVISFTMKFKIQHSFTNIKVASFNCRGLNDKYKRAAIFEYFANSDATVICLQETKLSPDKELIYSHEWNRGPSFFNSIKGGKSGTAILFNTWQIEVKKFLMDEAGRIIALDIDICGTVLHLINTYFPNVSKDQYFFIKRLQPFFYSHFPILWCGDHNISTDNTIDRFPRRLGCDRFGINILEIIRNFDLIDTVRSLFPSKNDLFTFSQGNSRSRIDKIIVQNSFVVKNVWHEISNHSDHVVLKAQVQLNQKIERGFGVWKNNASVFKNTIFVEEFTILWENWVKNSPTDCAVEFWILAKKKIKGFLTDIGHLLAENKKKAHIEKYTKLMDIFRISDNSINVAYFLNEKKQLA